MSNAVVVKQGAPSKPGEKVDTDAAPVKDGDRVAAAVASDEGKAVERKEAIATAAKRMAQPSEPHPFPRKGAKGKPAKAKAPKAKAAKGKPAAPKAGGGPSGPNRLTAEWMSTKKKDVAVKDEVTVEGVVIKVIGRWTKRKGDKLIPMVTGRIVSGAPDGKKKGDRHNAVAAEVTHVN